MQTSEFYLDAKSNANKISEALGEVSEVILSTMGPRGNNVLIRTSTGHPLSAKDGATVAVYIMPEDPIKALVAQMVIDGANRTAKEAGDGTTTCTCLIKALYAHGMKMMEGQKTFSRRKLKIVQEEVPAFQVVDDLNRFVEVVIEKLEELAVPLVDEDGVIDKPLLDDIATISANNSSKYGKMISDLIYEIGPFGTVFMNNTDGIEPYTETKRGYFFDSGLTNVEWNMPGGFPGIGYDDALIFLADQKIEKFEDFQYIWAKYEAKYGQHLGGGIRFKKPLVLILADFFGDTLASMIMTKKKTGAPFAVVKAPWLGSQRIVGMNDIAAIAGCEVYGPASGRMLRDFDGNFGEVKKIISTANQTTIYYDPSDRITERVQLIDGEIEELKKQQMSVQWHLERKSKLGKGIGIINTGASSNVELNQLGLLLEDAQRACFSALEKGAVPGGGVTLARMSKQMPSFKNVLMAPYRYLHGKDYVERGLMKNLKSGKDQAVNLTNVYDPVKVTICALRNAMSVVSQLLTAKYIINCEKREMYTQLPNGRN